MSQPQAEATSNLRQPGLSHASTDRRSKPVSRGATSEFTEDPKQGIPIDSKKTAPQSTATHPTWGEKYRNAISSHVEAGTSFAKSLWAKTKSYLWELRQPIACTAAAATAIGTAAYYSDYWLPTDRLGAMEKIELVGKASHGLFKTALMGKAWMAVLLR